MSKMAGWEVGDNAERNMFPVALRLPSYPSTMVPPPDPVRQNVPKCMDCVADTDIDRCGKTGCAWEELRPIKIIVANKSNLIQPEFDAIILIGMSLI